MRLSTVAFLAVTAGTAMADLAIKAPVGNVAKTNNKRSLSRLFRRDDLTCSADPDCQTQKTSNPYAPHNCKLPVTNDPEQKGYDAIVRNGYGLCENGSCDCSVLNLSQTDLLNFCTDLVGTLEPRLHVHGACIDTGAEEYVCEVEDPSGANIETGQKGDVSVVGIDEWQCVNGKYTGS